MGVSVGWDESALLGATLGARVGITDGTSVGQVVEGTRVGTKVGDWEGANVGNIVGMYVVGYNVEGKCVEGIPVGWLVMMFVGNAVGLDGTRVGDSVKAQHPALMLRRRDI